MPQPGFLQLDEMSSDEDASNRGVVAPKVLNSNLPGSSSTGDSNIERVLKEQIFELRSVLTGQHTRALHAVTKDMEITRQLKVDLSDLRAENQRLRLQLHAAGLSTSIPPWHGMGGTGESSSSDSKPRPPPGPVNHPILSPLSDAPALACLPGSTNAELEKSQLWQNMTPKAPPPYSSWSEGQDSDRHIESAQSVGQSSAATFDKVETWKDDFKSVVPFNCLPSLGTSTTVTGSVAMGMDPTITGSMAPMSMGAMESAAFAPQTDNCPEEKSDRAHLCDGLTKEFEEQHSDDDLHHHDSTDRSLIKKTSVAGPKAVFADAAAMKEKLRAALHAPEYDVKNFYHTTGFFQKIARSSIFDHFTLVVICLNAMWIWIDTDYNNKEVLLEADLFFFVGENSFCVYFAFEWVCRFMAFKRKRDGLKDSWFVFDSCLVLMMVLETWVVTAIIALTASNMSGGLGDASILRLLRLLRLTRMARMARLLRALPELMILIKGMAVAARSVFFTLVLLVIIIYLFAIAFTTLTKGTPIGDQYFSKVPQSMSTLLLGGILPDHSDIVHEISGEHVLMGTLFLIFMLLGSLTVMNMLMGVIVQVVSIVSAVEKEQMVVSYVKHQLQSVLKTNGILTSGNNNITKTEFEELLQKGDAARALHELGVDVVGLVDFTDFIFQDDVQISFPNFMEMVLQLRGTNTATVKDIVDFRKFILSEMNRLEDKITSKILPSMNKIAKQTKQEQRDAKSKVTRMQKQNTLRSNR